MAPAIAITAPTDRSMPRVAITSTMPSDKQRHRRAAVENVDQAAEQPAILQAQVEELRRYGAVEQYDDDEREDLGEAAAWQARHHRRPSCARAGPSAAMAERMFDTLIASPCNSSTWARSRSTITRSE